jgi:predicted naringenin-chalcone synthase
MAQKQMLRVEEYVRAASSSVAIWVCIALGSLEQSQAAFGIAAAP